MVLQVLPLPFSGDCIIGFYKQHISGAERQGSRAQSSSRAASIWVCQGEPSGAGWGVLCMAQQGLLPSPSSSRAALPAAWGCALGKDGVFGRAYSWSSPHCSVCALTATKAAPVWKAQLEAKMWASPAHPMRKHPALRQVSMLAHPWDNHRHTWLLRCALRIKRNSVLPIPNLAQQVLPGQLGSVGALWTHPSSREVSSLPWEWAAWPSGEHGTRLDPHLSGFAICLLSQHSSPPQLPPRKSRISTRSLLGGLLPEQSTAQESNQSAELSRNFRWKDRFYRSYQKHFMSIAFENPGFEQKKGRFKWNWEIAVIISSTKCSLWPAAAAWAPRVRSLFNKPTP